ncbi:MAG: ABC transporter ATP-binding protein [Elusimicrobiales bacterium]|nr:ABC transporter ATP-binding protein [Elusimicrobiales bacterium]
MDAIACKDVVKVYSEGGMEYKALRGISFSIEAGDFVSIMGPSGCGKSTLLNILGLLDRATSGHYFLDGADVSRLDDGERSVTRRKKIGFVFQSYNLLPRMSALDNVCLPMGYHGVPRKTAKEKAHELLSAVGLKHKMNKTPLQLSGGERQRVAIARALSNNPSIILADEPTGNLDSVSSVEIMELLKQFNAKGMTLVLVTHDPNVAAKARRVIRISDGELVC